MWTADALALVLIVVMGVVLFLMQQCVAANRQVADAIRKHTQEAARHTNETGQLTEVLVRVNRDNALYRQLCEAVITLTGEVLRLHKEV